MKKTMYTIIVILALTASACSALKPASSASSPQPGPASGTLPAATQLILGTFKLEDTGQAVTAEQASELLPLWQTFQVLSESDTAANQEIEALTTQIQETMTKEQMQAITDMNLRREDIFTVMQEKGMGMGNNPAGDENSTFQRGSSSSNTSRGPDEFAGRGAPPDGGFPGGGPGMGPGGQGQNLSAEQIATAQASRQAGNENTVQPALINALIEFLKQKAGS